MPESTRDRIAYILWCYKENRLDLIADGNNFMMDHPSDQPHTEAAIRLYADADHILGMLLHDVKGLFAGGDLEQVSGGGYTEGLREVAGLLGEEYCLDCDHRMERHGEDGCDFEYIWGDHTCWCKARPVKTVMSKRPKHALITVDEAFVMSQDDVGRILAAAKKKPTQ